MRKHVRDQMVEILITVKDGIEHVANVGVEVGQDIVKDCSEAMMMTLSVLEENLSPERFGEYKDSISKIVAKLDKISGDADAFELCEEVFNEVTDIGMELLNEQEVKTSVVFMPYKAAMWDCMETIWMEASIDPQCFTLVVPIPYYDRKPDGSLVNKTYEGDLFPDYVQVVPYEDYDLKKQCPDVVYIHNPYDDNNYLTSLDPAYYSHEIKKHTEKLVYVPYYVGAIGGRIEYNVSLLQGGVDIIIAHNKKDYNAYTQYGNKYNKEIAVLGSPKIDSVINHDLGGYKLPNQSVMPESWKPVIEGKKVFLLITSVSTVYKFEKFGDKLRTIIDAFKDRDDAALIWRPHPLTVTTINSARPQSLAGYRELVKYVKSSDFAILDDTPDVHRAIAASHAYIGPVATSINYMYSITGKPMYIADFENVDIFSDKDYKDALSAETISRPAVCGDKMWGVCTNFNGLVQANIKTGEMTYLGKIPGDFAVQSWLFSATIKLDDKLLLVPYDANVFVYYDLKTGKFTSEELQPEAMANGSLFWHVLDAGEYWFFFPYKSKAIVRLEKSTGKIEYFYDWFEKMSPYMTDETLLMFVDSCLSGDKVYLTSYQNNIVAELNLVTMDIAVHSVGLPHYRYFGITQSGRYFWLARHFQRGQELMPDSVVRWDKRAGKVMEINKFPSGLKKSEKATTPSYFAWITNFGDDLLALPNNGTNMMVKIDPKTNSMSEFLPDLGIDFSQREKPYFPPNETFTGYTQDEEYIYLIVMYDYSLLKISKKTGEWEKVKLRFKDEKHKDAAISRLRFKSKQQYTEHIFFTVEDFITGVLNEEIPPKDDEAAEHFKSLIENTDGTAGKKIHEYVMEALDRGQ